jgi:hypothetical protein
MLEISEVQDAAMTRLIEYVKRFYEILVEQKAQNPCGCLGKNYVKLMSSFVFLILVSKTASLCENW